MSGVEEFDEGDLTKTAIFDALNRDVEYGQMRRLTETTDRPYILQSPSVLKVQRLYSTVSSDQRLHEDEGEPFRPKNSPKKNLGLEVPHFRDLGSRDQPLSSRITT